MIFQNIRVNSDLRPVYMEGETLGRWVNSPTWGPPPPCKQALKSGSYRSSSCFFFGGGGWGGKEMLMLPITCVSAPLPAGWNEFTSSFTILLITAADCSTSSWESNCSKGTIFQNCKHNNKPNRYLMIITNTRMYFMRYPVTKKWV